MKKDLFEDFLLDYLIGRGARPAFGQQFFLGSGKRDLREVILCPKTYLTSVSTILVGPIKRYYQILLLS